MDRLQRWLVRLARNLKCTPVSAEFLPLAPQQPKLRGMAGRQRVDEYRCASFRLLTTFPTYLSCSWVGDMLKQPYMPMLTASSWGQLKLTRTHK